MSLTAQRSRTSENILGVDLYFYHNPDSIAVWVQDGPPLGMLLQENGGWSVGWSLDSSGRTIRECLEIMVRNREVSLV